MDGKYLACERLGTDKWFNNGIMLTKIDGTFISNVRWKDMPFVPIGVVTWSSDSAGFVFYTCNTLTKVSCSSGGSLVYYDVVGSTYTSLAPSLIPAFFCRYKDSYKCRDSAAETITHNSDIPASSPVPGLFYYSVLMPTDDGKPRVLGSVDRANPNSFHPLTLSEFTEPSHATVSSDNKLVTFVANSPETI
jgi:hypothetical protein